MRLRAITWNIHKCIGGVDRKYRPERVIEVLAHYQADVVLLQEVDEDAPRSSYHRQVDLIGDALGLRHRAFGPNVRLRRGRGRYGNATLSRWPLSDVENIDLTIRPKKSRGVLCARCHVEGGEHTRSLMVFNMHLGLAGYERRLQIRRFLGSHPFDTFQPRTPILVGGDFNDLWGTLGRRFLRPAGFQRAGRMVATYPAFYPARPLDSLHVRGDIEALRGFASRMKTARDASDHLPLIADLELRWA
jgi:endonuclease/exonuclease/phosphatase family metal-dependent hydrolase